MSFLVAVIVIVVIRNADRFIEGKEKWGNSGCLITSKKNIAVIVRNDGR